MVPEEEEEEKQVRPKPHPQRSQRLLGLCSGVSGAGYSHKRGATPGLLSSSELVGLNKGPKSIFLHCRSKAVPANCVQLWAGTGKVYMHFVEGAFCFIDILTSLSFWYCSAGHTQFRAGAMSDETVVVSEGGMEETTGTVGCPGKCSGRKAGS